MRRADRDDGRWIYQVKLLGARGAVAELEYDARTLSLLEAEGRRLPLMGCVPARHRAGDLTHALQHLFAESGRVIDVECAGHARFAGEAQDLEQMVGNLMENACKWSRGIVDIRAGIADGRLWLRVDDDGLSLAIVSALAAAYDSRLRLEPAALGGGVSAS